MTAPRVGLIFPGQGSQWVGMGEEFYRAFPEARAVFVAADEALGEPLSRICFEGPQEALENTAYAQPAILTCTVAIWRILEAEGKWHPLPVAASGHSLGEYSALVAAGALPLADAVRLVRARGHCMEKAAGGNGSTGMMAVLGLTEEVAESTCLQASADTGAFVSVANYNCPGQVVIGGQISGLEMFAELARERGAKRLLKLPISVASHTQFMAPAAKCLAEAVAETPVSDCAFPVVGNAYARPLTEAAATREELPAQLVRPLDWPACVDALVALGVDVLWEIGPRSVLAGLCKRISGAPPVRTVTTVDAVTSLLRELREG